MKARRISSLLIISVFCLGFLLCCILTIFVGDVPWSLAWKGALERLMGLSTQWNPLLDERLPRLIVLLCTGASLAVSGAVMQALFNNPLASPSIFGISCGGSLLVVLALYLEWHLEFPYIIPMAAFSGCLLALLLVYALSRNHDGSPLTNLLLTGIALSTLLMAIQGATLYALRDHWPLIQTLTEWEAGTTTDRNWKHVHMQLPLSIVGLTVCWIYRREIDILALGEEEATNLGIDVKKVRWRLFLCVAILTGGALAAVGVIAFFGLVLPHLVRHIQGPSNQRLIPLCMIAGSTSLAALDLCLRIFHIRALSIGNISAILGALFFLILLFGDRRNSLYLGYKRC